MKTSKNRKGLRGTAKPNKPSQRTAEARSPQEGATREASRIVDRNIQSITYGDYILGKGENILRIGFQNFNGLTGKENDPVDTSIRNWVTDHNFDVFGISEVNLYWPKVRRNLQFQDRLGQWWQPGQFRGVMAYNRTEKRIKRSIRQYGGTAQISRTDALCRECSRGEDPRGL